MNGAQCAPLRVVWKFQKTAPRAAVRDGVDPSLSFCHTLEVSGRGRPVEKMKRSPGMAGIFLLPGQFVKVQREKGIFVSKNE